MKTKPFENIGCATENRNFIIQNELNMIGEKI